MKCKSFWLVSAGCLVGLSSCAGPTTPLGAVWAVTPEQAKKSPLASSDATPHAPVIRFTPSRQVLHGPSLVRISIDDPNLNGNRWDLAVRYNGLDITKTFLRGATIHSDPLRHRLIIQNPAIRLSATQEHSIEVLYRNSSGLVSYSKYETPECDLFHPQAVTNFGRFTPPGELVRLIEKISREKSVNPAFSTGLIAQESAFNPQAVSWAKAVGLTQITPIAEEEILQANPSWPAFPGFNHRPVPAMKALIMSGKVNSKNEWRLSPDNSIRGGIDYAIQLSRLWNTPENIARIRAVYPKNLEPVQTRLILASYHSGYSRVLAALETQGTRWMYSSDLTEARKYVNRILSYCSYFTEKEFDHENAT